MQITPLPHPFNKVSDISFLQYFDTHCPSHHPANSLKESSQKNICASGSLLEQLDEESQQRNQQIDLPMWSSE